MKKLIILVVLAVAVGVGWMWFSRHATKDAVTLSIAFDRLNNGKVPAEIKITGHMSNVEPPEGDTRYNHVWQKWVDQHLVILDEQQETVTLKYQNGSSLLGGTPGTDAGFARIELQPGHAYTLQYRPKASSPQPYIGTIAAPAEPKPPSLLTLTREKR